MKIWVDLDNTPHVPFFAPIVRELERRGHDVVLTARDAFQVCQLAEEMGVEYRRIGTHWGRNPVKKVIGLAWRTAQLVPFYLEERPDIALSHGARAQMVLSNVIRLPSIAADDYECSWSIPVTLPKWLLLPDAITDDDLPRHVDRSRVRYYRGLKEDVYVPEFEPDPSILDELGLGNDELVVTVRPPADEAHYRNPESDVLFVDLMTRICDTAGARAVLLPRNEHQGRALRERHSEWFRDSRTIVPERAVNGLDLLWFSDLAVSGGGTMNREAAALGIPAYSIFRGQMGAVDRSLEQAGRLTLVRTPEEVQTRIALRARDKSGQPDHTARPALSDIVDYVEEIVQAEGRRLA